MKRTFPFSSLVSPNKNISTNIQQRENNENVRNRIKDAIDKFPNYVIPLESFSKSDYDKNIEPLIDREMMLTYQRSMFQFIHQGEAHLLPSQLKYLSTIKL